MTAARLTGAVIVGGSVLLSLLMMDVFQQLQLTWIVLVPVAAPFWIGMYWRRATTAATWTTIVFCALVFFIIPWLAPLLAPGLRTNAALVAVTPFVETTTTRRAAPSDVARRQAAIRVWDEAQADPTRRALLGPRPAPLEMGAPLTETRSSGGYPIYWTGALVPIDADGNALVDLKPQPIGDPIELGPGKTRLVRRYEPAVRLKGSGQFRGDFLLYELLGIPLEKCSDATLATLQLPPKIIAPFLVMIVASLLTRPNSQAALDRYYVKMKTPVRGDPQADAAELERSYREPDRFNHRKLWPASHIEIQKPTPVDMIGFVLSLAACFGIIGLALWLGKIGA